MRSIFLSASVPLPDRDPRYYDTADVISIRDAVRAVAAVVLPHAELHWGGHPSITPLIRSVAEDVGLLSSVHVNLYQSAYFIGQLPAENEVFERITMVPAMNTREASLEEMRRVMLSAARFDAAIFIGGMEGVEDEFSLFRSAYPGITALPIASTGAAARVLYDRHREELKLPSSLVNEYTYPSLFRRLIPAL
jgi:hypothetical protein